MFNRDLKEMIQYLEYHLTEQKGKTQQALDQRDKLQSENEGLKRILKQQYRVSSVSYQDAVSGSFVISKHGYVRRVIKVDDGHLLNSELDMSLGKVEIPRELKEWISFSGNKAPLTLESLKLYMKENGYF